MQQTVNESFRMWSNYLLAVDEYTKGDDKAFGRFMRIICYYGIYNREIAETEVENLFFTTLKASIDSSVKNTINGRKGGNKGDADFMKPTVEEIKAYCEERQNGVDYERFYDYYEANGWVQGKSKKKISDWKACVRTWERNGIKKISESELHSKAGVL